MGGNLGTRSGPKRPDDDISLPPPSHDSRLWAASCRPVSTLSRFSSDLLFFQPDCRLFCPNGLTCALYRGSDESSRRHNELFIHTSSEAIHAHAATAPPVPVANHPGCAVTLPHVRECHRLDGDAPSAACVPPALHGRHIHVWVHGFRQRYFRVIGVASHLVHQLATSELATSQLAAQAGQAAQSAEGGVQRTQSASPCVLAFLWPCHSRKAAYALARADATRAAAHLRRTLQALAAAGCRVTLVAHSMGSRVALHALLADAYSPPRSLRGGNATAAASAAPAAEEAAVPPPSCAPPSCAPPSCAPPSCAEPSCAEPLCAELVLLGAAVDASCLSPGAEFDRARVRAAKVCALFSAHDEVLKAGFRWGEAVGGGGVASRALGLHGLLGRALPAATTNVDVSGSVGGHNPNSWLASPQVMAAIASSVPGASARPKSAAQHSCEQWSREQSWISMAQPQADFYDDDDQQSSDEDGFSDFCVL